MEPLEPVDPLEQFGFDVALPQNPSGAASEAWAHEPQPTNFILLWPFRNQPTAGEVIQAMQRHLGREVRAFDPSDRLDGREKWVRLVDLGQGGAPLIVWCEPMRPLSKENLEYLNATAVQWVVGVETMLRPGAAYEDFMATLALLGRAFPKSPAILNVNTECWHTRQELDESILGGEIDPDESILWVVHAIGASNEPGARVWVYTNGLSRCGLPELEMLDVPVEMGHQAAAVLNSIACLVYENGLPDPGETMEIGRGLEVAFQPWKTAAAHLADHVPGHATLREDHGGHERLEISAAVCAPEPALRPSERWVWPSELMQRLKEGQEAVYLTGRATDRLARLARGRWDMLAETFSAMPEAMRCEGQERVAAFLVQAGFAVEQAEASEAQNLQGREHLWFEALRFDDGRVEGRLQNEPAWATNLHRGDVIWIDRDAITDWAAVTAERRFGPLSAVEMQQTLRQLIETADE